MGTEASSDNYALNETRPGVARGGRGQVVHELTGEEDDDGIVRKLFEDLSSLVAYLPIWG
jgi:hypothetical protein